MVKILLKDLLLIFKFQKDNTMTKNLLVAFLSVFMLNTAIHSDDDIEEGRAHKKMRTEAPNSDTASFSGSSNGMTGLSRYSISSVSAPYQEKIERVMQERKIPYSQDTFAQNEINYKFLKKLLGYVPDEIAYGDTRCKNRRDPSVNMDCPSTPKKGFNVYRKSDRPGRGNTYNADQHTVQLH